MIVPVKGLIVAVAEAKAAVLVVTATHGIDLVDDALWDRVLLKLASLDDAASIEVKKLIGSLHVAGWAKAYHLSPTRLHGVGNGRVLIGEAIGTELVLQVFATELPA